MITVADMSPLRYLILVEAVDVLLRIFGQVHAPPEVMQELGASRSPELEAVRRWAASPPAWLTVQGPRELDHSIRLGSLPGKVENVTEQSCREAHAAPLQQLEERPDRRYPPLSLGDEQERNRAAKLQSQGRGASPRGEVVEYDLGPLCAGNQGEGKHGCFTPVQPEWSQGVRDRRARHDLDPGRGPYRDRGRIIGVQTAELFQNGFRNEHRHARLIQQIQKAQAVEEDDRRGVDDAPQAHSRPPF